MSENDALPVMELFYTLQGEGVFAGQAAVFVRLGGCDVGCVWCDVKESWQAAKHPLMSVSQIVEEINKYPASIVVITGGEPLMYNLDQLTRAIQSIGKRTHIETSGAYPLSGNWNWICVSPKKFKSPLTELIRKANELKVIVYNKSDFDWAINNAEHASPEAVLLLQPEWSREKEMLPLITRFVMDNPRWRASLQTHKYMNIP
jgi:organic radical activating enzyme